MYIFTPPFQKAVEDKHFMDNSFYNSITKNRIRKLFEYTFSVVFLFVLIIIVFDNQNIYYTFSPVKLLVSAFLGIALFIFLHSLFEKYLNSFLLKYELFVVILLFLIYFLLQITLAKSLGVAPSQTWDFGVVYSFAEEFVLHGAMPNEYFLLFPNNTPLYLFWVFFFRVLTFFGIKSFYFPSFLLNVFFVDISILFIYCSARLIFKNLQALFILIWSFLTPAFFLYTPIFYTDTLTLPFVSGIIFTWLLCKEYLQKRKYKTAILCTVFIILLSILGCTLKFSLIILPIAICIDCLLLSFKNNYIVALLSILIIFLGYRTLSSLSKHASSLPEYDYQYSIPYTHWVMMGLNGYGDYHNEDYTLTLTENDMDSRTALNIAEIKNRLETFGILRFFRHLEQKASFTWGEGTYTATEKLNRSAMYSSILHYYVIHTEPGYPLFGYVTFGILFATLFFMWLSCINAIKIQSYSTVFLRIAIFGLFLFLLIWETRTRYIVHFLPAILLCASDGLNYLHSILYSKK
jgi:hypothetical protein